MNETPDERERRLAELNEKQELYRRMQRVEAAELKKQPKHVQTLMSVRNYYTNTAEVLSGIEEVYELPQELPRTKEARLAAAASLNEYAAALGVEISSAWVGASSG
jgi:hypothetical protein